MRLRQRAGWSAAQLEAAGYGRGRVVTVSCPPGLTTISLFDVSSPMELTVLKGIADVTEDDVRRALAAAATESGADDASGGAAAAATPAASAPLGPMQR